MTQRQLMIVALLFLEACGDQAGSGGHSDSATQTVRTVRDSEPLCVSFKVSLVSPNDSPVTRVVERVVLDTARLSDRRPNLHVVRLASDSLERALPLRWWRRDAGTDSISVRIGDMLGSIVIRFRPTKSDLSGVVTAASDEGLAARQLGSVTGTKIRCIDARPGR